MAISRWQLPPPRVYRYQEEWVCTYVGTRERAGTKEAVVEINGVVKRAPGAAKEAHGSIKGAGIHRTRYRYRP